ncbi:hypothetical protein ELV32_27470, partial [Escherichia coli]
RRDGKKGDPRRDKNFEPDSAFRKKKKDDGPKAPKGKKSARTKKIEANIKAKRAKKKAEK